MPAARFEEKAEAMGIRFTHVNGARGDKWMPETMGGGVAVLDYDGDGRLDVFFVNGAKLADPMPAGKTAIGVDTTGRPAARYSGVFCAPVEMSVSTRS